MYSTQGIVLNKISVGEADAIFSIYTKDFGKIRAMAQGIKKEEAKLKGHLERFNLVDIAFVLGKSGERLTRASAINTWGRLRCDHQKTSAAFYITELVHKNCFEGQKDDGLWKLISESIRDLDEANPAANPHFYDSFLNSFEKKLLELLGYGGSLDLTVLERAVARPF